MKLVIENLHLHFYAGADPVAFQRLETSINELKETVMTQGDELKREVQENTTQSVAVVQALGTLNTTVQDLKTQLENASNGLTADEAQALAAQLDEGQTAVRDALAEAGFTPPEEPGPTNPIGEDGATVTG